MAVGVTVDFAAGEATGRRDRQVDGWMENEVDRDIRGICTYTYATNL